MALPHLPSSADMQPGVMLTTAQVAACLSITPRQVGHLAKQHGVGTKVGRDWIFTDQEVRRLASRPKVGRPAKG
jgi:hypothetical protein